MRKLLVLLLLIFGFSVVAAQDAPAAVTTALNDLNQQTGGNYVLGSTVGYTWREEVFTDNNLGCSSVAGTAPGTYRAYVVEFDTNFDQFYEWEYRVSVDGAILILCRRPAPPVDTTAVPPGPTAVPATPSRCSSLEPRIGIGSTARVLPPDPNIMRSEPALRGPYVTDIPVGGEVRIVEGPRCTDAFTWWQVDFNGTVGWTVESNGSEYWMEPVDPNASLATPDVPQTPSNVIDLEPVICDPALPPRLSAGDFARVTEGSPNRVRDQAGLGGAVVGEIPGGAVFRVFDGPVCSDGLTWWQVGYDNVNGWTAEGSAGEYFLEPPTPWVRINKDNIGQIAMYGSFAVPEPIRDLVFSSRLNIQTISTDTHFNWVSEDNFAAFGSGTYTLSESYDDSFSDVFVVDGITSVITVNPDNVRVLTIGADTATILPAVGVTGTVAHPSGTLLATYDSRTVTVWDLATQTAVFTTAYEGLSDVVWSPDGQYLGVAHGIDIELISISDWQVKIAFQYDPVEVLLYRQTISISPDNRHIVAVGNTTNEPEATGKAVCFIELSGLDSADPTATLTGMGLGEGATSISRAVFTADSSSVLVVDGYDDNTSNVRIYAAQAGEIIGSFDGNSGDSIAINPDGTLFAVYSASGANTHVTLWGIPPTE